MTTPTASVRIKDPAPLSLCAPVISSVGIYSHMVVIVCESNGAGVHFLDFRIIVGKRGLFSV
jgi:hypothetical protein